MYSYEGQCQCGISEVKATFPVPLQDLQPRKCSCSFCVEIGGAYISHPAGTVEFNFKEKPLIRCQGSEIADFLFCPSCSDLIGVAAGVGDPRMGVVAAHLLVDDIALQEAHFIPKQELSAEQKLQHWAKKWSKVTGA